MIVLSEDWEKEGTSAAFSAETYISNVLSKLAKSCGKDDFKKSSMPFNDEYHPELDETELLLPDQISGYKSLLDSANWIITLGRFDIAYATNSLSRYSMPPRQGHMESMYKIFGYLRVLSKGKIIIDVGQPAIRETVDVSKDQDWIEFYPDAEENTPLDRLEPRGGALLVMWMQTMLGTS